MVECILIVILDCRFWRAHYIGFLATAIGQVELFGCPVSAKQIHLWRRFWRFWIVCLPGSSICPPATMPSPAFCNLPTCSFASNFALFASKAHQVAKPLVCKKRKHDFLILVNHIFCWWHLGEPSKNFFGQTWDFVPTGGGEVSPIPTFYQNCPKLNLPWNCP